MARLNVEVSFTETLHFRRLVKFVEAVDAYAQRTNDAALKALVKELHEDLLRMGDD